MDDLDPDFIEQTTSTNPEDGSTSQISSTSQSGTLTEHLTYPTQYEPEVSEVSTSSTVQARPLLKDRLYVGNLHPSVDEYVLLKVFSKYGKVSKLDYLFHKSGPFKGKPRGYAFVEYSNKDDADEALKAHDKLLRGRKLIVTYANQAPLDPSFSSSSRNRRPTNDAGKPTTLSLLKSTGTARSDAKTDTKIARMEAKLRQLEGAGEAGAVPPLPAHPSLPPKPSAAAAVEGPQNARSSSSSRVVRGPKQRGRREPLPSLPLPIAANHPPAMAGLPAVPTPPSTSVSTRVGRKSALSGVKMVKSKKPPATPVSAPKPDDTDVDLNG